MLSSYALVKNLNSSSDTLVFSGFKLSKICLGDTDSLRKSQRLFQKAWPLYGDWIYEKLYDASCNWERIPFDVEDTLLLLRLFRTGDLVFLQPCIEDANGELSSQVPYRVMAYIHTTHKYQIESVDCSEFDRFYSEIMSQPNWSSTWFQTTRRFFLYGGGKEYNPRINEVDRIVDYMTALECSLVPESDFVGRRLRERAVSLLNSHKIDHNDVKRLLKDFYEVRSAVVHGSDISSLKGDILARNRDFEDITRRIIVEALKTLPHGDNSRKTFLKQLFDLSDQTRAEKVYGDFCAIKDKSEKRRCFDRISTRLS